LNTFQQKTDIAVVGAGCAGAYIAYRLANDQKFKSLDLNIYEADSRHGGRLLSAFLPGLDSFRAELGAMRIPAAHSLATALLDHLFTKPEIVEFQTCDALWHLRGQRENSLAAITAYDSILKGAEATASRPSPVDLIIGVITKTLGCCLCPEGSSVGDRRSATEVNAILRTFKSGGTPKYESLSPTQWQYFKRHAVFSSDGPNAITKPLQDIGLWNLLYHWLRPEEYFLLHDAFGYESIVSNWSVTEAIPWFLADFAPGEYRTLTTGLEEIVNRLLAIAYVERNIEPRYNHILHAVLPGPRPGDPYRLLFEVRGKGGQQIDQWMEVSASTVVLALPKGALERIRVFDGPEWTTRCTHENLSRKMLLEAVDSVTRHSLFKLFILYETPWWVVPGSAATHRAKFEADGKRRVIGWRALTDLPLRQIYHFDESDRNGKRRGIVMASYSDEHYVDFWRPLGRRRMDMTREGVCCRIDDLLKKEERHVKRFGARQDLVAKAERQLGQLHDNGAFGGNALAAFCKDWGDEFTYAGWHTWNPGVDVAAVVSLLRQPCTGLHICGEAYSTQQGWVEGALQSAELALSAMGAKPA
jgi:hypothetical protein